MPLVIAMMAVTLLTGLGTAVVLGTLAETAIAGSYHEARATFYAAEAVVEFVVSDLKAAADWDAMLAGDAPSPFVDGPPGGPREVGAASIGLTNETTDVNAVATTVGSDSPYELYAHGWLGDMVSTADVRTRFYVAVWIADLTQEDEEASGNRVVGILGRAYGATGSRRSVAVSVTRADGVPASFRVLSWAELR